MKIAFRNALIALAFLTGSSHSAHCHGIAGNRYFDGTLTFDDPAVADEAILPYYTYLGRPTQGSNIIEDRIVWSFARLLTPTLAVTFDGGWVHQNWPVGQTSGFDTTDVGLKYEVIATISMKPWFRSASLGVSAARVRKQWGRTTPTRFSLARSSGKGLVISQSRFLGCVPFQ